MRAASVAVEGPVVVSSLEAVSPTLLGRLARLWWIVGTLMLLSPRWRVILGIMIAKALLLLMMLVVGHGEVSAHYQQGSPVWGSTTLIRRSAACRKLISGPTL